MRVVDAIAAHNRLPTSPGESSLAGSTPHLVTAVNLSYAFRAGKIRTRLCGGTNEFESLYSSRVAGMNTLPLDAALQAMSRLADDTGSRGVDKAVTGLRSALEAHPDFLRGPRVPVVGLQTLGTHPSREGFTCESDLPHSLLGQGVSQRP